VRENRRREEPSGRLLGVALLEEGQVGDRRSAGAQGREKRGSNVALNLSQGLKRGAVGKQEKVSGGLEHSRVSKRK
jgi:hypothetical protein